MLVSGERGNLVMADMGSTRRRFLRSAGAACAAAGLSLPAYSRANRRPQFSHGVQSGDVDTNSAMVWTRADRPSLVSFEIATRESFAGSTMLTGIDALPDTDMTIKRLLQDLPAGQNIFYRLQLTDLDDINAVSEPIAGRFRTAPASRRSVRFAWSGDTAGQGWGIDDAGMVTYAAIASHDPDFFIHSGDAVYADGPMTDEVTLPDGTIWHNRIVTEAKRKVAETLDEFRGQWKYNLLDGHLLAMNARLPTFFQWDDHDVVDNWSPVKDLTQDQRYTIKSVPLLRARASRAFHEMAPIRFTPAEPGRVYRKIAYGPLLDVFFLDLRSYRGPNGLSIEETLSPRSRVLGAEQLDWLKAELASSRAVWKIIACDMPIGLVVWDDWRTQSGAEAVANGDDGAPRGRELEFAELLSFISRKGVANTVWLTADVHYAAAHFYDPAQAKFSDFLPFWEFVSGPIHAGTFGPNRLDMTFGPQVVFMKTPAAGQGVNLPPSAGLQFFGLVDIDGADETLTVRLMDRANNELFATTLDPVRGG
jgi:alkaline phosphatase D